MKVSSKTQYAILAMMHLSNRYDAGRPVTTSEIAAVQKVPLKFLTHIMIALQKGGLVNALRGKDGGYLLSRIPSKISLGDIVRAIEGPVLKYGTQGASPSWIVLASLWREAGEQFEKHLDSIDLYTIASKAHGVEGPMFYI
jgi:Rrf2 family cysteine metabolism transcriptional repressor